MADELPEDLQPALVDQDEYVFPNNNRRRIPGVIYLIVAAVMIGAFIVNGDAVLVNRGVLFGGIGLAVFGLYSLVTGWNLDIDEREALVQSTKAVGFPVGHASAQMGWRGLLSRPTWRILLYSNEEPPATRGFVLVDGVNGDVVDAFTEDNPEDWSEYEE